jgi:hypothetical protein
MNRFTRALEARYQAQIEESLAVIELYLNKAVGVGEHPDVLSVLDDEVSKLDSARSKLATLSALFPEPQE